MEIKKVIIVFIVVCVILILSCCSSKSTIFSHTTTIDGAENYYEFWEFENVNGLHCTNHFNNQIPCKAFPSELTDASIISAEFIRNEAFAMSDSYRIIVEVKFDNENINSEKKRLCDLGATIDNNTFSKEAYITIWNYDGLFEYVLFDANVATYVYLRYYSSEVNETYLPENYPNVDGSFCIEAYHSLK